MKEQQDMVPSFEEKVNEADDLCAIKELILEQHRGIVISFEEIYTTRKWMYECWESFRAVVTKKPWTWMSYIRNTRLPWEVPDPDPEPKGKQEFDNITSSEEAQIH